MGLVWRAVDERLNRPVAVKTLPFAYGDPREIKRLAHEAQALAQVSSPHVVNVHDYGRDDEDGTVFVVLELVEGRTLAEVIRSGDLPTLPVLLDWAGQALRALETTHAAALLHRDIKPANIIVTGSGTLKILDFGISRFLQEVGPRGLTRTGHVIGTPEYMAPEQFRLDVQPDCRTDLFALGVVLYQLVTGELPDKDDPMPPGMTGGPDFPLLLDRLIMGMLARDPAQRPPDASTARAELARAEMVRAETTRTEAAARTHGSSATAAALPDTTAQAPAFARDLLAEARQRIEQWRGLPKSAKNDTGRRSMRRLIEEIAWPADDSLRGFDLRGAPLRFADLGGADLSGADLTGADLLNANLGGADCTGAVLHRANLRGAQMARALLTRADLSDAFLDRAMLTSARLINADLSGIQPIELHCAWADLTDASVGHAKLFRADLHRSRMCGTYLVDTTLIKGDLRDVDLSGADLSGTEFHETDLDGATLSGALWSAATVWPSGVDHLRLISSEREGDGAWLLPEVSPWPEVRPIGA